jgi:hypothetical protein
MFNGIRYPEFNSFRSLNTGNLSKGKLLITRRAPIERDEPETGGKTWGPSILLEERQSSVGTKGVLEMGKLWKS